MATIGQPTLYKMVTPPKGEGSGMGSLVKSMNSLGTTINSIAFIAADMNKNFAKGIKHQISKQEDISKKHTKIENKKLTDKKKKEAALRKLMNRRQDQDAEADQKSIIAQFGGTMIKAAKGVLGFFEGLAKALEAIFVGFVSYAVFNWLGKAENKKKVKKFLDFMSSLGKFIIWAVTGLVNMGLGGITDFLDNPVSFKGLFGLVKFLTALGLVFAPGATISVALAGVMSLFKAGRLVPLLKGFFTGVWGLVKGLLAFLAKRPLIAATLLAAGWGAYMIFGRDDEGEDDANIENNDETKPNLENSSENQVLGAMDERIAALQEQINTMSWWEKLTTNRDDNLRQEITEIKNQNQTNTSDGETIGEGAKIDTERFLGMSTPRELQAGGSVVIPSNPFVPKMDMGGWISGPQSGYPVSLDGGGSTSFIGHGTEWVGFPKASRGGAFVVPFDTPSTRTNPGLTKKRLGEAQKGGFAMPSFDMGGFYPQMQIGGVVKQPTTATTSMNLGVAAKELEGMSTASGPDGGANSCAWAVNKVYKKAGLTPPWGDSLWVPDAEKSMMKKNYKEITDYAKRQAGDIMIMYDNHATDPQAHIGVVLPSGDVLSNSSSNAAFTWRASPEAYNDYYGNRGKIYRSPQVINKKDTGDTTLEQVSGDDVVDKIQPTKAWWDPLGVFTGKPEEKTSGNTIGESALNEFDSLPWGEGTDVSVQPMQLPAIDTTPPSIDEDIPQPIFIPNEYEPPAHPYIKARFGMMADADTCPDRLF